jgi:hypothetical protein
MNLALDDVFNQQVKDRLFILCREVMKPLLYSVSSLATVFKLKCVCVLYVERQKINMQELFHYEQSSGLFKQKKWPNLQLFYQNSWNFTSYSMQLFFGDIYIFKSTSLPVADLFAVTAWIWNLAIYTANPK